MMHVDHRHPLTANHVPYQQILVSGSDAGARAAG
jgi:hypothetical protein